MSPPTFTKGIGRLAVDRYDFQTHINGQGFRQNATTIDIANPSLVYGSPATVEMALEDLNTFIMTQISAGQGFCVVGDGYNTWHNANGTINFDSTIPSLDTILNPIFTAIINGTTLPAAFQRVKFGGIILIKAGTYIVKQTIFVPPGITLLGEGYGTKIVNATSMNFGGSTPPVPLNLVSTAAPIFNILYDGYRSSYNGFTGGADAAVDPNLFMFSRETRIYNMVIADNFVEPTLLGDTYYRLPQNSTSSSSLNPPPLITQQVGSSLSLYGVLGLGRVSFSSGKTVSSITGTFLGLDAIDGYIAAPTETFCKLDNCFLDGFSLPINLSSPFSNDGYGNDFLEIKNCKIRAYGYFNGDSIDGYANTTIKCNIQNVNIANSLFYGNATNVTSLLYLTLPPSSTPALQDRSKIIIMGNQVIIDKNSNDSVTNLTWLPIYFASAISSPSTVMTSLVYGNDFQDTFDLYVDDGYQFTAPGLGAPQFSINRTTGATTLRNNNITLDGYDITLSGNSSINKMIGTTTMVGNAEIIFTAPSSSLQVNSSAGFGPGSELTMTGSGSSTTALLLLGLFSDVNMNGGRIELVPKTVISPTYTVDSGTIGSGFDTVILIQYTSTGPVAITLPPVAAGRYLIFKDIGDASANAATITPVSGNIDSATHVIINTTFGYVALISDGLQWYTMGKLGTA